MAECVGRHEPRLVLGKTKEERKHYGRIGEYRYLEFYKEDKKRATALQALGWAPSGAILFVVILALLAFFFAKGTIDGTTIGIIAGTLLIHEFGHVAMMALFGSRDVHVMIVPGLARLARERNMRVPSWQEFLVLLAGPLPGLILGWGLQVCGYFVPSLPEFWREAGLRLALFHNLNFLAILPADGGRVMNLLIMDRIPCMRLIYLFASMLSVVGSVLFCWMLTDVFAWPILLALVSTVMAVPDNWRHARMGPWAKHNLTPDDSESDALMKAFQIVEATNSVPGLEKRGWTHFVDRVVRYGCSKKMGFLGSAICFLLFFSFLCTPAAVLVSLAISDGVVVRGQAAKLESRIAALRPEDRPRTPLEKPTRQVLDRMLEDRRGAMVRQTAPARSNDLLGSRLQLTRTPEEPTEPAEETEVEALRSIDWKQAASWLAEDETTEREEVVLDALRQLVATAEAGIDLGEEILHFPISPRCGPEFFPASRAHHWDCGLTSTISSSPPSNSSNASRAAGRFLPITRDTSCKPLRRLPKRKGASLPISSCAIRRPRTPGRESLASD